ncbi:MAG TPA: hypothetical protein VNQ77_03970 [Frankiaceae bacterium]|nr:hypothetical protein [Frankiaceae bacterium]
MTGQRVTVPVPAETGVEDRLAGALTFRHAAYLAVAAAGVAVMLLGERSVARLLVGALVAIVGVAGAAVRPYGEPLDRLVPAALLYLRRRGGKRNTAASSEAEVAAPSVEPEIAVELPVPESDPDDVATPRRRVSLRPLVPVLAAVVVVAVVVARWPHPAPPPPTRVVVVPVPVQVVDPWEEAIDDAVDAWLDDVASS